MQHNRWPVPCISPSPGVVHRGGGALWGGGEWNGCATAHNCSPLPPWPPLPCRRSQASTTDREVWRAPCTTSDVGTATQCAGLRITKCHASVGRRIARPGPVCREGGGASRRRRFAGGLPYPCAGGLPPPPPEPEDFCQICEPFRLNTSAQKNSKQSHGTGPKSPDGGGGSLRANQKTPAALRSLYGRCQSTAVGSSPTVHRVRAVRGGDGQRAPERPPCVQRRALSSVSPRAGPPVAGGTGPSQRGPTLGPCARHCAKPKAAPNAHLCKTLCTPTPHHHNRHWHSPGTQARNFPRSSPHPTWYRMKGTPTVIDLGVRSPDALRASNGWCRRALAQGMRGPSNPMATWPFVRAYGWGERLPSNGWSRSP